MNTGTPHTIALAARPDTFRPELQNVSVFFSGILLVGNVADVLLLVVVVLLLVVILLVR
jgi:hypothetical protein